MRAVLHELVTSAALHNPDATAIVHRGQKTSYAELDEAIRSAATGLVGQGLARRERVAIYLPKQLETVVGMFAAARAGGSFVPVNPVLKAAQVAHIVQDCTASMLVTSPDRLAALKDVLPHCRSLKLIVLTDATDGEGDSGGIPCRSWEQLVYPEPTALPAVIDTDVAAIFYTSGSTGKPKGVVLSHRNLVAGAKSVSYYLENRPEDRILAVLPLSFDAGFSQLSTAFCVGATVVLHDHLFAADIVKVAARERITGITAVPPLWAQIADVKWPAEVGGNLRYFANTGGKMPRQLLGRLRKLFPRAAPYLMYGLTEAFRSTFLPPTEVDRRPDSIGKAIPNAEILVVHEDGSLCKPGEAGELVHRGALVALGYWNAPEVTARRFRKAPLSDPNIPHEEIAVWSGDIVRTDDDGFLYFVGRSDDMIKTSGYRVSPTEIEEVGFESGLVKEIAAIGIPDERLGQRIVVVAAPLSEGDEDSDGLLEHFRASVPAFMVPDRIEWSASLPRSPNGKIDRQALAKALREEPQAAVQ